jgi:hypothetical protein
MSKYANGFFQLTNPQKYVGKKTPHYRSSWEFVFMTFCDNNPSVLQWASEAVHINYKNPLSGKNTIYVPDFLMVYVDVAGKKHAELVEIKPTKETSLKEAGRSPRAQAAAILNMAKWEAARQWCKAQGLSFRIVTEKDIFHMGGKR